MRYLKLGIVNAGVLVSMVFSQIGFAQQIQRSEQADLKFNNLLRVMGLDPQNLDLNSLTQTEKFVLIYEFYINYNMYEPTAAAEKAMSMSDGKKNQFLQHVIYSEIKELNEIGSSGAIDL